MVGDFVLAVDGGATKTQMVLMEMGTGKLYFRRGGSSSHETLPGGFDEMTFVLSGMIGGICREAGIEPEDICFSSLGMAGMDLPFQLRRTEGILRAIGLGEFRLQNDAFLPVLAEAADGCGIGIINGTGFSAAAVDAPQLFEAGFEKDYDCILCVTAPEEERLRRIVLRDGISAEQAKLRMKNQKTEEEYRMRSDFVLNNGADDRPEETLAQILGKMGIR